VTVPVDVNISLVYMSLHAKYSTSKRQTSSSSYSVVTSEQGTTTSISGSTSSESSVGQIVGNGAQFSSSNLAGGANMTLFVRSDTQIENVNFTEPAFAQIVEGSSPEEIVVVACNVTVSGLEFTCYLTKDGTFFPAYVTKAAKTASGSSSSTSSTSSSTSSSNSGTTSALTTTTSSSPPGFHSSLPQLLFHVFMLLIVGYSCTK